MLTFFRNFFKTKIGLAIALAFLVLIGFAFASMDVSSSGSFGGIAGGSRVAVVGDEKIGTAELNEAADQALAQVRQDNPQATMQTLLADDGLDQILDGLINRYALIAWGEKYGLRAGRNLVNSEIRQIPAAAGATGDFDQAAYDLFLRNANLTDAGLRQQIRTSLFFKQAVLPAVYGAQLPDSIAKAYARTFKERRKGSIALIPAALFAPTGNPTDAELQKFYTENSKRFVRPERRVLRYAAFGPESLGDKIEPSETEIAAYYKDNQNDFAAKETRSFTQLIVPTQQAADAIRAKVAGGQSFAAAAQGSGLRTTDLTDLSRKEVTEQASSDVAKAYFGAPEGSVTQPARSALGWHIARVTSVQKTPAKTLAQAKPDIIPILREQKRARGIAELATIVEDRLADGAALSTVAQDLGLKVETLKPITADGRIYGTAEFAPQEVAPILEMAFQVEEGEAEVAALPDNQNFLIFEVSEVTLSATAPLKDIREDVIAEWRRVRGNEAAEKAADRILARVKNGKSLSEAVAAEKVRLPAPDAVEYSRQQLAQMRDQRIPTPIALMFGMAEGTAKKLEGDAGMGWYIVDLQDITLDKLDENDPLIAQAKEQLGQSWSAEYSEQLIAAMRKEMGAETNQEAVTALRNQLLGTGN